MKFANEAEMRQSGIAFDPRDPNRAVPISELLHSQDVAYADGTTD